MRRPVTEAPLQMQHRRRLPGRRVAELLWRYLSKTTRRAHEMWPRRNSSTHIGLIQFALEVERAKRVNEGKTAQPGREGAALLWGLVEEGARLLHARWPHRNSSEYIALAQFRLEVERARGASAQNEDRE
jgi:hypothetical protein